MDANSDAESSVLDHMNNVLGVGRTGLTPSCTLCHRLLTSDNDAGEFEAMSLCVDCKFLLMEDLGTPMRDYQRRTPVSRRRLYSRSESFENIFSQQLSQMINGHERDNQSIDGDGGLRSVQRTGSRNGSRRWRRVQSDTESDGVDSLFGESESNVTFNNGYRNLNSEFESVSYSAYGGNSDDGNSYLDYDHSGHSDEGSDFETDTDIDPMHAGMSHWNSDSEEEDEWEEVAHTPLRRSVHLNERNWQLQLHARTPEGSQRHATDVSANSLDLDAADYLDARTFEELLEHRAETDGLRRGAPPAAVSVINNLPCLVVKEDHKQLDSLACAICKDSLVVGTVVNQLPCSHMYHPFCILPWLTSRNSCPICRYELPTDDLEYEQRKQRALAFHGIQQHEVNDEDGSLDGGENDHSRAESIHEVINGQSSAGGRWFFVAAVPVVTVVGVALMLWLGNPVTGRRLNLPSFCSQGRRTSPPNNQGRRWWSLF